ncbi:MAG TPA: hypothetical protein VJQ82_08720 [Terriglobales bacterium]|nr:hypothetical protein [Terriglobales bacterium]
MAININPAHKGLLHKNLGIAAGKPIPSKTLAKAKASAGPAEKKRIVFAQNARHWNKGKRPATVKTDRGVFGMK